MKRKLFFILYSFISIQLFAGDTILLDFESATIPTTVASWLNYANAGASASNWSAANPSIDSINSSLRSYQITKSSGDPYWTGLEVTFSASTPITTSNQYLHVLVYKSTTSRIALTYTPDNGGQSPDAWVSNSTTGQWIDYVLTIPTGINLKTFAIKIADNPGIYYFDQIILSDNPASRTRTIVTINPQVKNQVIDGWGGSLCWWANIMGGFPDTKIKTICDWITDPVNGLNMNIFRFNIGGGDDPTHNHMRSDGGAMPGYKASLTAPYDWTQDANQRKILQQLIASRIAKTGVNDIQIIGFSNSPPYWMTVSGCSAGNTADNSTNLRSDMFGEFADYLTEVVKHYHDSLGITFNYIEPFNEPDVNWKAFGNQEGCYISTTDQLAIIRNLYTKLSDKNMLSYCQITANDANNIDHGMDALNTYTSAGDIVSKLGLVSIHTYGGNNRVGISLWGQGHNLKILQSESGPIWVGGTNENQIMVMADRIIADIKGLKCTGWCDWQFGGTGSPTNNPWAMIVSDYNDPYHAITQCINFNIRAQFSRYIKAGYTIIDNNANNVLTALSPDENELVVVITNQNTFTQKYRLDLSKFSGFGRVKQIRTLVQSSYNMKNSLNLVNVTGNYIDYDITPQTVTTYVIPLNQATQEIIEHKLSSRQLFFSEGILHLNIDSAYSVSLKLYAPTGILLKEYENLSAHSSLSLNIDRGVYLVSVGTNGKLFSGKFIVTK